MNTIEIKHRYTGEILFSHECESNTLKKTVLASIKANANLRNADLRNANLSDADLSDADLSDANLRNANLRNADLSDADLSDADLWNANLSDAKLWNAQNIQSAKGVPMHCKWSHGITNNNLIHIGCEKRTIEEWDKFFTSTEELTTKRDTHEFRQIQAVYEAYKAYLIFLGGTHFGEKTQESTDN